MDEATMQLGLLMEAAQAQQKAADACIRKLKSATADLAAAAREEVHRVLVDELQALAADCGRASESLHAVRRAANLRLLIWSVSLVSLCSFVPLCLSWWLIPSEAQITALRARRDELSLRIADLEQRGGRIDLRHCGAGARLCVRVDRRAPIYGDKSDYLVVRGY